MVSVLATYHHIATQAGLRLSVRQNFDVAVKVTRGGHSLVSSVPMRDQRIVEHTVNSVIDI